MNSKNRRNPLCNKRILVTRAKSQSSDFSDLIRHFGGVPIECPLISIRFPEDREIIREAIQHLEQYEWIVFTSVNGVNHFFELLWKYRNDLDRNHLKKWNWAVVGEKTGQTLASKGLEADVMPDVYEASHLYTAMVDQLNGDESILLARGNLAKKDLALHLEQHGFSVTDLIVYETVRNDTSRDLLYPLIKERGLDMVTFTSPSTVRHFIQLLAGTEWRSYIKSVRTACIGPITAKEAEKAQLHVDVVASQYTAEGLISDIIRYYEMTYR